MSTQGLVMEPNLTRKVCLSYLDLEAGVRDEWVLSFPKKWHTC